MLLLIFIHSFVFINKSSSDSAKYMWYCVVCVMYIKLWLQMSWRWQDVTPGTGGKYVSGLRCCSQGHQHLPALCLSLVQVLTMPENYEWCWRHLNCSCLLPSLWHHRCCCLLSLHSGDGCHQCQSHQTFVHCLCCYYEGWCSCGEYYGSLQDWCCLWPVESQFQQNL